MRSSIGDRQDIDVRMMLETELGRKRAMAVTGGAEADQPDRTPAASRSRPSIKGSFLEALSYSYGLGKAPAKIEYGSMHAAGLSSM